MRRLLIALLVFFTLAGASDAAFMTEPWILQGGNLFGEDVVIGNLEMDSGVKIVAQGADRVSISGDLDIDDTQVIIQSAGISELLLRSGATPMLGLASDTPGGGYAFFHDDPSSFSIISIENGPVAIFRSDRSVEFRGNTVELGGNYSGPSSLTVYGDGAGGTATLRLGNTATKAELQHDGTNVLLNYTNDLLFQKTLNTEVARFTSGGRFGFGTTTPQYDFTFAQTKVTSYDLSVPGLPTATPYTTGGSCATSTFYYVITALDPVSGETVASSEVGPVSVTGPTGRVDLSWSGSGVYFYRIYRGTSPGAENVYYANFGVQTTKTDTCATPVSGSPPTVNTASAIKFNPDGNSWFSGKLGIGANPTAALHIGSWLTYLSNTAHIRMVGIYGAPTTPTPGDYWYDVISKSHQFREDVGTVGLGGSIYINTADSSAVANTTTETLFNRSYTLPVNSLTIGKSVRVTAGGKYSVATSTNPTIRFRVKIGSSVACDSGQFTIAQDSTNNAWWVDCIIVTRTLGAGGTGSANGFVGIYNPQSFLPDFLPTTNNGTFAIDTTATNVVGASVEWGTANASNTATLENIVITVLK